MNIELTDAEVSYYLRLPYALAYYTSQGCTFRDKHLLLMDTHNIHFNVRALIVGASRVTDGRFLHVATRAEEARLLSRLLREEDDLDADAAEPSPDLPEEEVESDED